LNHDSNKIIIWICPSLQIITNITMYDHYYSNWLKQRRSLHEVIIIATDHYNDCSDHCGQRLQM